MNIIDYQMIRNRLVEFVDLCRKEEVDYGLTPESEATPYARCFTVFLLHLLQEPNLLKSAPAFAEAITRDMQAARKKPGVDIRGKAYRQLLTFSLSALSALPGQSLSGCDELVAEQVADPSLMQLEGLGCLDGRAGSGNQAMFIAIFLLHAKTHLGLNTQAQIDSWVTQHLRHMNALGFWGKNDAMTHLQFQNGYHQHEILEYLAQGNPLLTSSLKAVRGLADAEGHFAPYPGGGGCYDYDAVFMLTPEGHVPDKDTEALLKKTAATIAAEQRYDGGFAESIRIRPRSFKNLSMSCARVLDAVTRGPLFAERLRYCITLQRPKHDRIQTHWSLYSRRWDESDLWDSWFRMLALARIDAAFNPHRASEWGFINYPGIGYHPSLRARIGQA